MRLDHAPRELVERAQRKDRSAFADLARRYERIALAMAYSVVGNSDTAGDVTQEAFLRAWQRISELNDPERFLHWFGRIVRNAAIDHVRRRPTDSLNAHDGDFVDPGSATDQDENRQAINLALSQLDELTRAAIVLRYYEELSSKQIAELLDLSPAAVDMRLSRGRAELKQHLMNSDPT